MKPLRLMPFVGLLAFILLFGGFLFQGKQDKNSMSSPPDEVKWGPAPNALPAGAQLAVLQGDPSGKKLYTLRLKLPGNYQIAPHFHPAEENLTIISGAFHVGMGDTFDKSKGKEFKAGDFGAMPAKMHHYAWTSEETVVQIHGMGPFAITYLNKADDPRK